MSDSFGPHEPWHSRLPCPSPSPRACSNPCPLSRWCHPTISSSVVPLSSYLQSFPASGSFLMSRLFASGGWTIGASALASWLASPKLLHGQWSLVGLVLPGVDWPYGSTEGAKDLWGVWMWKYYEAVVPPGRSGWSPPPRSLSFKMILFVYLFLTVLGLCCRMDFSLVVLSGGCSLAVVLLIVVAPLVAERGIQGTQASWIVACELSSCGSWALKHRLNSCGAWA